MITISADLICAGRKLEGATKLWQPKEKGQGRVGTVKLLFLLSCHHDRC